MCLYLEIRAFGKGTLHEAKEDVRVDAPFVGFVEHNKAVHLYRDVCVYVHIQIYMPSNKILITYLYLLNMGSSKHSRTKHPSVINLIRVRRLVRSSKRIWYPTSSPTLDRLSCATRVATEMAATLLGCVTPTRPLGSKKSQRY
jgi:hypothetical protein